MGKLINIGTMYDPTYIDIDAIIEISPRVDTYENEFGEVKNHMGYIIKDICGSRYAICRFDGEQIMKAKGLITDE